MSEQASSAENDATLSTQKGASGSAEKDAGPVKHRTFHCDQCGQPSLNIDTNGLCRSCRVIPPERTDS